MCEQTLFFSFHSGSLAGVTTTPDRSTLVLDLLKLLAVLVNEMEWTQDAEAAEPAIFAVVHRCVVSLSYAFALSQWQLKLT